MIKTIQINNFQSHQDTFLNLDPGINIIVGESDKGKSAVLRAINWALTNKPSGDSYISHWSKTKKGFIKQSEECSVTLTTEKGTLKRYRNSSVNGYSINGVDLEAIGRDCPEQIRDVIDVGEANIQKQLDSPFLLSQTSGEIARFFNQIIKLDSIDTALSIIDGKKRAANVEIRAQEKLNAENQAKVDKLAWVKPVEMKFRELEKLSSSLEFHRDKLRRLTELTKAISVLQSTIEKYRGLELLKMQIQDLSESTTELESLKKRKMELTSLIASCEYSDRRILECANILMNSAKVAKLEKFMERKLMLEGKVKALSELISKLEYLNTRNNVLKGLNTDKLWEKIGVVESSNLQELKLKYYKLKEVIKNMTDCRSFLYNKEKEIEAIKAQFPKTCPTCGQEICND